MQLDKFWVIAVVSNPVRYHRRYTLFKEFKYRVERQGVSVFCVELQQGDRPFACTDSQNPRHLQLRTFDELWHKENMINLGMARLPRDFEYVAWIDTDIEFMRPDWVQETVHQLQHYMVVQMFQQAIDLGPRMEVLHTHNGFAWSYCTRQPWKKGYVSWHPGFAWAARREAIDDMGSLIDWGILGSGDRHMACGWIGQVAASYHGCIHSNYKSLCLQWEDRCERELKRDIGFVPGAIYHYWHGKKADRQYQNRWKILVDNQFDPITDIKKDWQGLYQLVVDTPRQQKLRDDIRLYFRARNEDSIDLV